MPAGKIRAHSGSFCKTGKPVSSQATDNCKAITKKNIYIYVNIVYMI